MSYFPAYTYSTSTGWSLEVQPGSSSSSNVVDEWSYLDSSSLFQAHYSHSFMSTYYDEIPISKDSTLAGALGPVNSGPQDDETQPPSPEPQLAPPPMLRPTPQPAPQQVQPRFLQPVLSQPVGLALPQLVQPVFTQPAQLMQPVNPPPVAPTHLGVQAQNVAPPPAATTQRRAYVFSRTPRRRPRQPAGTPLFCKVGGCKSWTMVRGKKLARHRATHFPGQVGVECPICKDIFSRSAVCGEHLRKQHPQYWAHIAVTKGTQDAWGTRVGQELIDESLVDDIEYTPKAKYRL